MRAIPKEFSLKALLLDGLLRLPPLAFFGWLFWNNLSRLVGFFDASALTGALARIDLGARAASVGFYFLILVFIVLRSRPLRRAGGFAAWISAIAGTGMPMLIGLLPRHEPDFWISGSSFALLMAGNILSAYVLFHLGRSFSVMPEARRLITDGPYRRIRHPLYLAEGIAVLGLFVQYLSWPAFVILLVQMGFQFLRMGNEEAVLQETFPDYAAYMRRSRRVLPGIY